MMKRRLLLIALVVLLISVGLAVAQSSSNFVMQRFVMVSGGTAESAQYKVNAVIGQPATGVVNGANYKGSIGFLFPESRFELYLPLVIR